MTRPRTALVLSIVAFLTSAATCFPPKPNPPPARAAIGVVTTDVRTGAAIEGALVVLHTGEKGTTNADGYVVFNDLILGERGIDTFKERYKPGRGEAKPFVANMNVAITMEPEAPPARRGIVRRDRHGVCDDDGCFQALGVTVFWGAWGFKFDRARLDENLRAAASTGAEYIRVLGSVGGPSWADRETDPTWPDYDATIAAFTDHVYDNFGMRVQWTIFGGSPKTPPGVRENLVDRFASIAVGREHKIFMFEIANEAWHTGFEGNGGLTQLRQLGERLAAIVPNLVTLSDPSGYSPGGACRTYAGARVDGASMHYERIFLDDGVWRPVRQPWGWPGEYEGFRPGGGFEPWACVGQLPGLVFSNEPIGPQSSVQADDEPIDLVTAYYVAGIAQNGGYVFHAGPGIRGGGQADLNVGRSANFWELPKWAATVTAFQAAKRYTPPDLANWTRHNAGWPSHPFEGFAQAVEEGRLVRAYAATKEPEFVVAMFGIQAAITVRARRAMRFDLIDPRDGQAYRWAELQAGESITFFGSELPSILLKGRFL